MLTTARQRPVWSSNANYVLGSTAGQPTKIARANVDVADGYRPGEQAAAEEENDWRNQIDSLLAKVRSVQFATCLSTAPSTMLAIYRKHGYTYAATNASAIVPVIGNAGSGSSIAYSGESATARFGDVMADDILEKWSLAGAYTSSGSVATGAFGLWQFSPMVGTVTPLVHSSHVLPFAIPTGGPNTYLAKAYGGKTYCFRNPGTSTDKFVRLDPAGGDPDFFDMFLDGDDAASSLSGDRVAGFGNNLIHVFIATGSSTLSYDIGTPASPWTWNRTNTGINVSAHGRPMCVRYVAGFGCYLILMTDGTVYSVATDGSGSLGTVQASTGHTYLFGSISDAGWFAYAAETNTPYPGGQLYFSPDFVNIHRHQVYAGGVGLGGKFLFDSESWWLPVAAGTFERTIPIV